MKKIFIIAGEVSGDRIGSQIISSLKEKLGSEIEFRGVGGEMMLSAGMDSIFEMKQISLMGFAEVLPHIFKLKSLIKFTTQYIEKFDPDIVITIDSPGFCYRVTKALKGKVRAKFTHVVAPSVWAYKPSRAKKFADIYDLLLTLLPFEPPYFEKEGLKSVFVGHFALDQKLCMDPNHFREKYAIDDNSKIVLITPGSRAGEIKKHLDIFLKSLSLLKEKHDIFPVFLATDEEKKQFIEQKLLSYNLKDYIVTYKNKFEAIKASTIALAKSGTNSLEITLHGIPQVIAYRLNFLTWYYIKSVALIKFANLINIVAGREVIPELLQNNCSPEKIAFQLDKLLSNHDERDAQIRDSKTIIESFKRKDLSPANAAAAEIIKQIQEN